MLGVQTQRRAAMGFIAPCNGAQCTRRAPVARSRQCRLCITAQSKTTDAATKKSVQSLSDQQLSRARMRSEIETPFRSVRLVLFGFSAVSASMGLLISFPQLAGSLAHTQSSLPTQEVLQNIAINFTAAAVFTWLTWRDYQAEQRQIARLGREEQLAALGLQLANGKRLTIAELRGSVRVVMFAGTPAQVKEGLAVAEEFKAELMQRGVLVVPLPIYGASDSADGLADQIPSPSAEELRWRATPLRLEQWADWFNAQVALSNKVTSDRGLYIGLRLDGRVRTSGMGLPPWAKFAMQLAPLEGEGAWTGFMDGFDGEVNSFK